MSIRALIVGCATFSAALCSCLATAHVVESCPRAEIDAAIRLAETHPQGATLEIDLPVRRTGDGVASEKGSVFLDSEENYRGRCSLNIRVFPDAVADLKARYGERFFETLVGRIVHARGTAIRVPIQIIHLQKKVGYYFQTQLFVRSADDLRATDGSVPVSSPSPGAVSRQP